jgi:hypothetical protein
MRGNIVKLSVRSQTSGAVLAAILLISAPAASCSRALFAPPAGPGDPAPDASVPWTEATAACRNVRTYSAIVTLSGSLRGSRIPSITVVTALSADGDAHLQAHASGREIFLLAGRADKASLWLREDHRVVSAPMRDIVQNLADVSLAGDDLLAILTGCAVRTFDVVEASKYGTLIAVETAQGRVFIEPMPGGWAARGAVVGSLIVDYRGFAGRMPSEVVLGTADRGDAGVTLRFRPEQVILDDALPPQLFSLPAGASTAAAMTLQELRESGPLRGR